MAEPCKPGLYWAWIAIDPSYPWDAPSVVELGEDLRVRIIGSSSDFSIDCVSIIAIVEPPEKE